MATTQIRAIAVDAIGEHSSDNRLKYAIIFGAPIVASVALFWFLRRRRQPSPKKIPEKSKIDVRADAQRKIQSQIDSQDPVEKATGYKNKGNNLYKLEKYKEAVECYTDAIKVCPTDKTEMLSTFYQNRAAAYELLGMTENVVQDCTKALELNKRYSKAYFRRAKAWEQQGELRKCLEDSTCCVILENFTHNNALQLTDKILKQLGATTAKELAETREPQLPSASFIRNYMKSFCEDPVLIDLNSIRNNEPIATKDAPSGYDMAVQALLEENWDDVESHCGDEIDRNLNKEKVDKALVLRAGFRILVNNLPGARTDLETLLARENVDIKVRMNAMIKLATSQIHAENIDEALKTFEKAVEQDPNNADIYLHRGQLFLLLDQMENVMKNLELASGLRPDFASAAAQLAYTQFRFGSRFNDQNQQAEAMKKFDACMKKFPDVAEVYFLYAQLMLELGSFDAAEKYLNLFIEKDPKDASGLAHLGMLALQREKNISKAIEFLQKAINLDPKCQFAYETLGTLLLQANRFEDGMALFEKGISLAQTESEMAHLIGLKLSAEVQQLAIQRLGQMPSITDLF